MLRQHDLEIVVPVKAEKIRCRKKEFNLKNFLSAYVHTKLILIIE